MFVLAAEAPTVPPPLTVTRGFTAWEFDPYLAAVVLVAAGLYLYGVWRLRGRGDRWSGWRTFSFVVLGLGSIVVATQSFLATYDTTLFSVHMVQHMVLSMVSPIFLALGAPVTLALRTLARRPRRWLLVLLHSRVSKVLTFPLLTWSVFVGTPFALYFTSWYGLTLRNTYFHEALHLHFLLVGCLFFWPLLGLDPVPGRIPYPFRMLVVFLALPVHAWLGIAIMSSTEVLGGDWYANLGREWGASSLSDQRTGGGILWASGDLVGLIILGSLFVQWLHASEREAERVDRRLDRQERRAAGEPGEESELAAYNAMLARLHARSRR
ncbi:MAG: cytochrome c oxidase assembly protein [Streptosporangiales bacterium]|nr:cytochrome c oxidase assembly protein [Streptosporangiales bacterium]